MRVHHVAFRTHELVTLEAFYVGLGFAVVRRQAHSVWLEAAGAMLMLEVAGPDEPPIPAGSMELVAFAVAPDALQGLRERLTALGVAVEASTPFTIYVRDPDGRRVGFSTYRFDRAPND